MSNFCSRSCSGLTSAALFVAAGIIQIIAGAVLLKSKYVYLLSGPNFWTAAANICVGCLVAVATSVWKHPQKRYSSLDIAKTHLISALLLSNFIINATTTTILLLGEGNALLSIYVENNEDQSMAVFASEMLGYAYATSVITPVLSCSVCVLSILARCCPHPQSSGSAKKVSKRRSRRVLSENDSSMYSWVYEGTPIPLKTSRTSYRKEISPIEKFKSSSPPYLSSRSYKQPQRRPIYLDEYIMSPRSWNDDLEDVENQQGTSEIVPIQVAKTLPRNFRKGTYVKSPLVPSRSLDSAIKSPLSSGSRKLTPKYRYGKRPVTMTSFKQTSNLDNTSQSKPSFHAIQLTPLDSIREIPGEEAEFRNNSTLSPSRTSGYGSSLDSSHPSVFEETSPKSIWTTNLKENGFKKSRLILQEAERNPVFRI